MDDMPNDLRRLLMQKIRQWFPEHDLQGILKELETYGLESWERETERIFASPL